MQTSVSSPLDSAYSWRRLLISVAVSTVGSIGMWAIILVLPQVQKEFGIDRGEASLAYSATMVGFALGNLLIGRFVDRYGIYLALILSAFAQAAGFALAAISDNFWLLPLPKGF